MDGVIASSVSSCSFTACLSLSGGVPSGVPSLQFGRCCVRTDCRCVALDLLFLLICSHCPTPMLIPIVVVSTVGLSALPFCRRSSACSAGDTVAGGPVCTSLSLLASVVGRSCCCQCHTAQPASTWRCVLPCPSCPLEVASSNCPSVKVSVWGAPVVSLQLSSAAWHCVWCGCSRGVRCGSVGGSHCV